MCLDGAVGEARDLKAGGGARPRERDVALAREEQPVRSMCNKEFVRCPAVMC